MMISISCLRIYYTKFYFASAVMFLCSTCLKCVAKAPLRHTLEVGAIFLMVMSFILQMELSHSMGLQCTVSLRDFYNISGVGQIV